MHVPWGPTVQSLISPLLANARIVLPTPGQPLWLRPHPLHALVPLALQDTHVAVALSPYAPSVTTALLASRVLVHWEHMVLPRDCRPQANAPIVLSTLGRPLQDNPPLLHVRVQRALQGTLAALVSSPFVPSVTTVLLASRVLVPWERIILTLVSRLLLSALPVLRARGPLAQRLRRLHCA